ARANAALEVFESEARNAGIAYSRQAFTAVPVDAFTVLGAMARLYDLNIVMQSDPDYTTSDNMVPKEMLFQAGGPVLFMPYTHKGPLNPATWASPGTAAGLRRAPCATRRHSSPRPMR